MSVLIGLTVVLASVKSVYFKFEGLVQIKETVAEYYERRAVIINNTPENAVIVTRYADKYIYPLRPVLTTSDTADGEKGIEQLLAHGADVYWFDYLNVSLEERLVIKHIETALPVAGFENLELKKIYITK